MNVFKRVFKRKAGDDLTAREYPAVVVRPKWAHEVRFHDLRFVVLGHATSMLTELPDDKGRPMTLTDFVFKDDEQARSFFEMCLGSLDARAARGQAKRTIINNGAAF